MTLKQILQIKTIRNYVDEQLNLYKTLITDTAHLDKVIEFITNKIEIAFKPFDEYELLFEETTSRSMLTAMFSRWFTDILKNSAIQTILLDKSWSDFVNIGNDGDESSNTVNYSGYDLQNQEGQYQVVKQTSRSMGKRRIEYLIYLDQQISNPITSLVFDLQENLLKLYY